MSIILALGSLYSVLVAIEELWKKHKRRKEMHEKPGDEYYEYLMMRKKKR